MNSRLLQSLFTIAVLFCGSGCRKAATTASSTPTPATSVRPVSQVQASPQPEPSPQIAATVEAVGKPDPDLDTAVPVKTFEVKPPAAFDSDQFPQQGAFEFKIAGKAGQVLHVKLNQGWGDDLVEPLVEPLADKSSRMVPGGDELGNRLYLLPETGVYRVVAQRTEVGDTPAKGPAIEFALLDINDPLVDPEIRPEQISADFSRFAPQGKWTLVPYSHFQGEAADFWPSHLALQNGQFEFRIMPIEGYRRIVSTADIANLESALRSSDAGADAKKFPYSGYQDAALIIATRPKLIQGDGWRGFRWIGEYAQDSGCFFSDLSYIFEGITQDGKFFLRMQTGIVNPQATKNLTQRCEDESRSRTFDEFFEKQMPVLFDKELSSADPASFQPNLDQLDVAIRSFKIKP